MKLKFVLLLLLLPLGLQAKLIEVCHSCDYRSIKKAVEAAESGDTVFIRKGLYAENNIHISKPISIYGEEGTVIDGSNKGSVFVVSADNFELKNLKISNIGVSYTKEYAAVKMFRSNHFVISNLVLENTFFGILVEKSHFGKMTGNKISSTPKDEASSGNGIHLWHCSNVEISKNEIFGMRDGIYFEFVTQSKIHNNLSRNNIRYGLHFMFSNDDIYFENEFRNNGAGVAVMFSKFIKMYKNRFLFNWGSASYGLLLKEIYDAEIFSNVFEENTIGINGEGCTRVSYTNNTFIRNGWAVKIAGACYTNIFQKNNFMHNSFDLAYNSQLNDNRFENNYWSEYTGYDLDKDGIGDVPYRPVKLFSQIVGKSPEALILLRSLFVEIINFSEKVSPIFTPDNLIDARPLMAKTND